MVICLLELFSRTSSTRSSYLSVPRKLVEPTRTAKIDDKEADMKELAEIFSNETTRKSVQKEYPWFDSNVTKFILTSIEDFKKLLKWLDDLEQEEKWNEREINEILFGLGIDLVVFVSTLLWRIELMQIVLTANVNCTVFYCCVLFSLSFNFFVVQIC